jgi:hypothetical protein
LAPAGWGVSLIASRSSSATTAIGFRVSMARLIAAHASARYIAPESMYVKSSVPATILAMVLLPAATGPSMAMHGRR